MQQARLLSTSTDMHDIESESLPAHVSLCQERYKALEGRLDAMEIKIEKIESMITDIHEKVLSIGQGQDSRWNHFQWMLIGLLISAVGFLSSRLLF